MSLILSFSVDGTGKTLEEERLLLLVPVLYIGRWYGWEQFGWCSAQTHTQNTQSLSDLPVTSQLLLGLVITSLGAQTQTVGCRPPSYSGTKSLCTPACLTTCALGTAHLCFTGLPLAFSDLEDRLWPRLPFKLLCHTVVFTHIFSREVWTPALGRELPFIVVLP